MASNLTVESCCEQTIPVAEETCQRMERLKRAQWLRAAILGANDGLLSTTSLMLGIGAAKDDDRWTMILSGLAGAVAGACSMAVGEFVSVSTQRDVEQATSKTDIGMQHDRVKKLDMIRNAPCKNLTPEPTEKMSPSVIILEPQLLQGRSYGRSPTIEVMTEDLNNKAVLLTLEQDHDKEEAVLPNPYKAAVASALAFLLGSVVPLASAALTTQNAVGILVIAVVSSIALAVYGCLGAYLGGSPVRVSAARVLVGGWIAMAITYGLLKPFDRDDERRDTH